MYKNVRPIYIQIFWKMFNLGDKHDNFLDTELKYVSSTFCIEADTPLIAFVVLWSYPLRSYLITVLCV